jgi:hypothetical protein
MSNGIGGIAAAMRRSALGASVCAKPLPHDEKAPERIHGAARIVTSATKRAACVETTRKVPSKRQEYREKSVQSSNPG